MWQRKQPYNINVQIVEMKKTFPQFEVRRNTTCKDYLTFTGELQPHPALPVYKVKITYRGWKNPRVQILSPKLVETPPHFYDSIRCLCLYHNDNFKWKANSSVAKFIVPWTASWIYFYEKWKESGTWYGEEAAHNTNTKQQND